MKVVVATLSVVMVVVVSALAAPDVGYGYDTPSGSGSDASSGPAQYNFQWDVNDEPSGNFYGHQEQRDGDRAEGSYYVRLPDTRLMRVEYYVDETGYHPTITYEGEAQFPDAPASAPAPGRSYSQPDSAPPQAPGQSYSQPAPGPAPGPAPAPSQLYTPPGK